MNVRVFPEEAKQNKSMRAIRKSIIVKESKILSIGLLDIFGFENFENNSFEQLCINFTNEKLQQLYIFAIFKSEEQEFIDQGLQNFLGQLNFVDNQNILDLIDKYPNGIFDCLDESCSLGSGTDELFLQKMAKLHAKNSNFLVPKASKG